MDIPNCVELYDSDRQRFLDYLADHLETQPVPLGIRNFTFLVETDNTTTRLVPNLGEYPWVFKDGDQEHTLTIALREEGAPVENSNGVPGGGPQYYERLTVSHADLAVLREFLRVALTYMRKNDANKVALYRAKSRGYWEQYNTVYAQSLDNVFLDPQTKKSIVSQIDAFVANKEKYIRYGRPYKLNYLLTGVPGSGKSSLVKALAQRYRRPLYILSFSKTLTDDTLIDLMSDLKDDAILLLEDIDAFFENRKAVDIHVSFSCLINVLDGTLNKGNGVITILTANNPDRLDRAMLRPGRIDRILRFDYPKRPEVRAAFRELTGCTDDARFSLFYDAIKQNAIKQKIAMSGIIDYLFRHPEDYLECVQELLDDTQTLHDITKDETSGKLYT